MFNESSKARMLRLHIHKSDQEKQLHIMSDSERKISQSAKDAFNHKPNYKISKGETHK